MDRRLEQAQARLDGINLRGTDAGIERLRAALNLAVAVEGWFTDPHTTPRGEMRAALDAFLATLPDTEER